MKDSFLNALLAFNGEAMIEAYKAIQRVEINHDNVTDVESLKKQTDVTRTSLEVDVTKIFEGLKVNYQHYEVRDYFKDVSTKDLVNTVLEYFDKEVATLQSN